MSDIHLDASVLQTLQVVMEDEYTLLLDTFVADSEERIRTIGSAAQAQDGRALFNAAHSFKGSCSNMGASALARLCRELETAAQCELWPQASQRVAQIESEFGLVRSLLRAELQRVST